MIELAVGISVLLSVIGIIGGVLSIFSFFHERKEKREQREQHTKQADLELRKTEAAERSAAADESAAARGELALESPPQIGETTKERAARIALNARFVAFRKVTEKSINNLTTSINNLTTLINVIGTKLEGTVTASQYLSNQGIASSLIAQIQKVKNEIEQKINEYQNQGIDPDEIQRHILTTIGESLLQMAKTPVPPPFPVRDYGITTRDTEERDQSNG